jgi:hypothetical protein
MTPDPAQLSPAKGKRYRRFFHASIIHVVDRNKLGSRREVEDLVIRAGFVAAVYLFPKVDGPFPSSAERFKSIGFVRSAELAADWLSTLRAGRRAAYSYPPAELVAALCADPRVREEIFHLVYLNQIMRGKIARQLQEDPEEFGRRLATSLEKAAAEAATQLPGLIRDMVSMTEKIGSLVEAVLGQWEEQTGSRLP